MKNKIIYGLFLMIILVSSISLAVTDEDVKKVLRVSILEFLEEPSDATLNLLETKDLLDFYLDVPEGQTQVDISGVGLSSGKLIKDIFSKALINYTERSIVTTQTDCIPDFKCRTYANRAYQTVTCDWHSTTFCNYGCLDGECKPAPVNQTVNQTRKQEGICWKNEDCTNGTFCEFENCAVETGTCVDIPTEFFRNYDPVCGCNGKTYPNDLRRKEAKVSKDYDGVCMEVEKHLFVVDDSSPASDVILSINLMAYFKDELGDNYESRLNSEVTKDELDYRVTTFIYNGQVLIIVGDNSPAGHVMLATKISNYFKNKKNINAITKLSSEITSDDLREGFPSCNDSDGGLNYDVKGIADDGVGEFYEDVCLLRELIGPNHWKYVKVKECSGELCNLQEGFCKNDVEVSNIAYSCSYGCKDGACVEETNCTDEDFDRCKSITITSVGTLINFPAYINLTKDDDMLSDYSDLRFYSAGCSDGGSLLDYEIENYTNIKADIWVKTTLSPGGNVISVCYKNNTAVSSVENAIGVWDTNFKMVQHMDNGESTETELNETDSLDDVYANQGVATDGTYLYISGHTGDYHTYKIWKRQMDGTIVAVNDDALAGGTDMGAWGQINHIYLYDGKIYAGSNTHPANKNYIRVYDADTLEYETEYAVHQGEWKNEGAAFHDNAWWVIYCVQKDFPVGAGYTAIIEKYDTDWNYVASYDLDYTTIDIAGGGYQGITWKGDDVFLTIHEGTIPEFTIDQYHWTGSGFTKVRRIIAPDDVNQGIAYNDDKFYIAQRGHPTSETHSITITEFSNTFTLEDSVDNYNTGIKKGSVNPSEVDGKIYKGQSFDGSNSYVDVGGNSILNSNELTVEVWVKTDTDTPMAIFAKSDTDSTTNYFMITASGYTISNPLIGILKDGVGDYLRAGYSSANRDELFDNNWHHVVVTTDGIEYKIYLDGVNKPVTVGHGINNGNSQVTSFDIATIGARKRSDLGTFFNGLIDEVRISNISRSADWINQSYQMVENQRTYVVFGSE